MEAPTAPGEPPSTVAVVTRLATRIALGDSPLGVIADALAELADTVDATRVVVAVDDRRLGRQVFTSARAPLGVTPIGLFGSAGTWTEPRGRLEREEAELVTATVGAALGALPQSRTDIVPGTPGAPGVPAAPPSEPLGAQPEPMLAGAVARAREHGWAFTLALVRFDDGDHSPARTAAFQSGLRPGDLAMALGSRALAVMLPAVRDDDAATVLATGVRAAGLPRCAFSLTHCPRDAAHPDVLLRLAARRLDEAIAARYPSSDDD